jgi:hypothetical protein
MPGAMNGSIRVTAMMCLLIELAVIVLGLDYIHQRYPYAAHRKPGADSLIAVSCLLSAVDAAVIAGTRTLLSASVLRVSRFRCSLHLGGKSYMFRYRSTFRSLAISKNPFVITAEQARQRRKRFTEITHQHRRFYPQERNGRRSRRKLYPVFAVFDVAAFILSFLPR